MTSLAEILANREKAGLYRLTGPAGTLPSAVGNAGLQLVAIDLAKVRSKSKLFDTFARGFAFPRHFGRNWDALNDCLCDLSWSGARGWVLQLGDGQDFNGRSPEEFDTLSQILLSVIEHWQSQGRMFCVLFSGAVPDNQKLREIYLP